MMLQNSKEMKRPSRFQSPRNTNSLDYIRDLLLKEVGSKGEIERLFSTVYSAAEISVVDHNIALDTYLGFSHTPLPPF